MKKYQFMIYVGSKVEVRDMIVPPGLDDETAWVAAERELRIELVKDGLMPFVTSIVQSATVEDL